MQESQAALGAERCPGINHTGTVHLHQLISGEKNNIYLYVCLLPKAILELRVLKKCSGCKNCSAKKLINKAQQ